MWLGCAAATAQTPVAPGRKAEAAGLVAAHNTDWEHVTLSGKFRMAGLPVTPSLRIYMQRDSLVMLSLRAPLMGEVGRAEITDSTITVIDKMHRVYATDSLDRVLAHYPGGIADLQQLLLGRIVIPGQGTLDPEQTEAVEIYDGQEGNFTVVAAEGYEPEEYAWGYMVNADGNPNALMVLPLMKDDTAVVLQYEWPGEGCDMTLEWVTPDKSRRATLELNAPDWNGKPFDRLKLGDKYREVTFDQLVKAF